MPGAEPIEVPAVHPAREPEVVRRSDGDCPAMRYYAHTATDEDGNPLPESSGKWQPLSIHLRNVADLAAKFAAAFGASDEARLAGLLHDLGKYSHRFQQRLGDTSIRGINHWSVGAAEAYLSRALEVSFSIEGHHTGMPSLLVDDEPSGLESLGKRLKKVTGSSAQEVNNFPESLQELLARHSAENPPIAKMSGTAAAQNFATALRTRFVFSCLVDADFLDTERHFAPEQSSLRASPELQAERALDLLRTHIDERSTEGVVNQLRRRLLDDCLAAAVKRPGLFTLTAPTGSGKTLSGLAFALAHAALNRQTRIIVVIPYTSIIEQTAGVYREVFESAFGSHYVLEHHSAVAPRERKEDGARDSEDARLRRARLAQENWDAPLVVTTNVQFFESLFGHKPSQCRKLHNIARSVVLFDEVQTLPLALVPSLLSAVNLLTKDYRVTAVFGTATQPAFAAAAAAIEGGWAPTEISSQPRAMAEALRRTRIGRRPDEQPARWPDLAEELASHRQVLCVVNVRQHAKDLFMAVRDRMGAVNSDRLFHLSAAMCPAHRHAKLAEIRRRLLAGEPCRLVSTQLIEAGVDVDFPRVYRALGPLDSLVQTAGRCNREGRSATPGEVTVFRPEEHRLPRGAYEQAAKVTESFLAENPDADFQLPETYSAYFARLYGTLGPDEKEKDPAFAASAKLHFPEAARACSLVGEETRAVIVRWGEGQRLVEQFRREKHLLRDDWRLTQRFAVNFHQSEFYAALSRGEIVQPVPEVEFYFWNGVYDDDLGVTAPLLNHFTL